MSDTSAENQRLEKQPRQNSLSHKLREVQLNIERCARAAGRDAREIRLIAVSKTRSLQEVNALADLGQQAFGENMVQDALTKIPYITQNVEWHFIGHLQSKKAGKIPGYFQWIHSVDSIKLAKKLSSAMFANNKNAELNCLIQVNVSAEQSKFGLMPGQVKPFLQEALQLDLACLKWRGLMTIGVQADEDQTRNAFRELRLLQQECRDEFSLPEFDQLSMGMSGDYCLAIEQGATMVRVGTSIFGQREVAG